MEYVSDKVSIAMQSCLIDRIVHRLRWFKDSDDSLKPIPLAGVVEEYLGEARSSHASCGPVELLPLGHSEAEECSRQTRG